MGVMKSLFSGKQMSEAFICSAFLALSGGFQDAYTYNTRNEVFSNAQTGNVVLMSQNFMTGKWEAGLKYLFPLFAFALGVLIAEQIQNKYKYARRLHWRQGILGAEILILFVVGFIPQRGNMIATVLVSFACAMQVQSFRKVNGFSYASTMCIGNLRSGTAALSFYLREKKPEQLRNVLFWNYSSFCGRSRNRRQSFSQLWNPYDLGILRTFDRQFPVDVPGYRIPEKRKIKRDKKETLIRHQIRISVSISFCAAMLCGLEAFCTRQICLAGRDSFRWI